MKKIDWSNLIVKGTEWFANLAVLNLCWLLYSLPVITLIPATDTVFELLNNWELDNKEPSIFKQFHATFKANFKESYKLGVPIVVVFLIIGIDIYFLNTLEISDDLFYILKYAFYTFTLLLSLGILYAIPFMKRLERLDIKMVIFALIMALRHPLITLTMIAGLIVTVMVFLLWPSMLFFFSISGLAWIFTKAAFKVIKIEQEKNLNEQL